MKAIQLKLPTGNPIRGNYRSNSTMRVIREDLSKQMNQPESQIVLTLNRRLGNLSNSTPLSSLGLKSNEGINVSVVPSRLSFQYGKTAPFQLPFTIDSTIQTAKSILAPKFKVLPEHIKLSYGNQEYPNNFMLKNVRIPRNRHIQISIVRHTVNKGLIFMIQHEAHCLEFPDETTIADVKEELKNLVDRSVISLELYCDGLRLDDEFKLSDFGLAPNSVIMVETYSLTRDDIIKHDSIKSKSQPISPLKTKIPTRAGTSLLKSRTIKKLNNKITQSTKTSSKKLPFHNEAIPDLQMPIYTLTKTFPNSHKEYDISNIKFVGINQSSGQSKGLIVSEQFQDENLFVHLNDDYIEDELHEQDAAINRMIIQKEELIKRNNEILVTQNTKEETEANQKEQSAPASSTNQNQKEITSREVNLEPKENEKAQTQSANSVIKIQFTVKTNDENPETAQNPLSNIANQILDDKTEKVETKEKSPAIQNETKPETTKEETKPQIEKNEEKKDTLIQKSEENKEDSKAAENAPNPITNIMNQMLDGKENQKNENNEQSKAEIQSKEENTEQKANQEASTENIQKVEAKEKEIKLEQNNNPMTNIMDQLPTNETKGETTNETKENKSDETQHSNPLADIANQLADKTSTNPTVESTQKEIKHEEKKEEAKEEIKPEEKKEETKPEEKLNPIENITNTLIDKNETKVETKEKEVKLEENDKSNPISNNENQIIDEKEKTTKDQTNEEEIKPQEKSQKLNPITNIMDQLADGQENKEETTVEQSKEESKDENSNPLSNLANQLLNQNEKSNETTEVQEKSIEKQEDTIKEETQNNSNTLTNLADKLVDNEDNKNNEAQQEKAETKSDNNQQEVEQTPNPLSNIVNQLTDNKEDPKDEAQEKSVEETKVETRDTPILENTQQEAEPSSNPLLNPLTNIVNQLADNKEEPKAQTKEVKEEPTVQTKEVKEEPTVQTKEVKEEPKAEAKEETTDNSHPLLNLVDQLFDGDGPKETKAETKEVKEEPTVETKEVKEEPKAEAKEETTDNSHPLMNLVDQLVDGDRPKETKEEGNSQGNNENKEAAPSQEKPPNASPFSNIMNQLLA